MRRVEITILVLVVGCRFDLPSVEDAQSRPFRRRIAIDPARVEGAQTQFPVWIALDDQDLKASATQSGDDIYFTSAEGAALPHQIQRWDHLTGRLEAWVRVDLNATAETVIELRYGDRRSAVAPDPSMVFSNSFVAVWHLDDRLDTIDVAEAKGQRPGTALGGLDTTHQVPAQLGGGVEFDGVNARIEFANPFAGNVDHTISAWVNQRAAIGFDGIVIVGTPVMSRSRWLESHYTSGVSAGFFQNDWPNPGTLPNIQNTGWILLHWTYVGSTKQSRIYLNGIEVGSHTFTGAISTEGAGGYIGYAPAEWGPAALNGILDEVRLSTAERSTGWIVTEFANQSSPQKFYAVGPEESVP